MSWEPVSRKNYAPWGYSTPAGRILAGYSPSRGCWWWVMEGSGEPATYLEDLRQPAATPSRDILHFARILRSAGVS